jgi:hypothetical protein
VGKSSKSMLYLLPIASLVAGWGNIFSNKYNKPFAHSSQVCP